jgi:elongation factor G
VSDASNWLIAVTIEPIFGADADRLLTAVEKLVAADAAFGFKAVENGHVVLMGYDEQTLNQKIGKLRCAHKVEVNVGAPHVAYRETVARATEIDYTHIKQIGASGQFARVKLRIEPSGHGGGNEFESKVIGGAVPKEYIPGVEKGVQGVWDAGILIGFPMMETKVTLLDGAYHAVDSSALVFENAARAAMKEGAEKAGVPHAQDSTFASPRNPSN